MMGKYTHKGTPGHGRKPRRKKHVVSFIASVADEVLLCMVICVLIGGTLLVYDPADAEPLTSEDETSSIEIDTVFAPTAPQIEIAETQSLLDANEANTAKAIPLETVNTESLVSDLVPEMLQYPEMQAGCEVYALCALLRSYRFDATPAEIVSHHLPFEETPGQIASAYSGSPYTNGEGLPPALAIAGNSFLQEADSPLVATDTTGTPFEVLLAQANAGTPSLVWTTMGIVDLGFTAPLEPYNYYDLEHCVVLMHSENDQVIYMDPQVGYTACNIAQFKHVYEQCGSMALTLSYR